LRPSERPANPAALGLAGRRVFLAGATGLIGSTLAARFGAAGADLVLLSGRSFTEAQRLGEKLAAEHRIDARAVQADICDAGALAAVREELAAGGVGALDVLVNCVTGFTGAAAGVGQLAAEEFRRVVDVDLVGSFLLTKELLPLLLAGAAPRLVLFSSLAGIRGRLGAAQLCAAKAGVIGLGTALAKELAPHRVPVNCVAPGPVQRPQPDGQPAAHSSLPPGVALSSPDDVADVVLYLASELSGSITGQVLTVNGGQP
jgi:3-oxoacyl-[acyl-carrier protein] reductase